VVDLRVAFRSVCLPHGHFCKNWRDECERQSRYSHTFIILVIAWGIVLFRGEYKTLHNLSRHNLFFLVISGIATGLSWIFYFKALQIGKVSQVAPVDKLSVALTILLSVVFLGEALNWKTAIGALLIICGTVVLIL
jgi:transporter family protein